MFNSYVSLPEGKSPRFLKLDSQGCGTAKWSQIEGSQLRENWSLWRRRLNPSRPSHRFAHGKQAGCKIWVEHLVISCDFLCLLPLRSSNQNWENSNVLLGPLWEIVRGLCGTFRTCHPVFMEPVPDDSNIFKSCRISFDNFCLFHYP
jgi:hypothetical protein